MSDIANEWDFNTSLSILRLPLTDLIYKAQSVHRKIFKSNRVQISSLLSIKTGSCPENCSYCPQSAHYNTGLKKIPLMSLDEVICAAQKAKELGATRFCMAAAWRGPRDDDLVPVLTMIREVKKMKLEVCASLGLLQKHQAYALKEAELDFYNHNIDTSEDFYKNIITTRSFKDRLETLEYIREAGIKVCCGLILGMGEEEEDRIDALLTLARLPSPPESVPINVLIRIPGTPLANLPDIDPIDFVKIIALARMMLPKSVLRLSAGREQMTQEVQALCLMAGANSIFYGEKLLTCKNPSKEEDEKLFAKLGMIPMHDNNLRK